MPTADHTA